MTAGTKVCSKCKAEKSVACFGKLSAAKDGYAYLCLDCTKTKMKVWRSENEQRYKEAKQRWADLNKDKLRAKSKKYYAENREKHLAACDKWAKENPSKVARRFAKRRAIKRDSFPSWLSAVQLAQIQEMYDVALARTVQTSIKHHVDHIHPLQGNGFNGLHVPWNLRVITAKQNQQKTNNVDNAELHLFWEARS